MTQWHPSSLLWLTAIVASFPALAGPDACDQSAVDRTCEGNQSDGVIFTSGPNGLVVRNLSQDITPPAGKPGVCLARNGGPGGNGWGTPLGFGTNGDTGGAGGAPTLTIDTGDMKIVTAGDDAYGVVAQANGGSGGGGGWATGVPIPPIFVLTGPAYGGNGGRGGSGGNLALSVFGTIMTSGDGSHGIFAESRGGRGGNGGWAFSTTYAEGGNGGSGGDGGTIAIDNFAGIETGGVEAYGILGRSFGGEGGDGGRGDGIYGDGGAGLGSGNGGEVTINNAGTIRTTGADASGLFAQSIGGFAGGGGGAGGLFAYGGSGNSAGDGGAVTVVNAGEIRTSGTFAYAIHGQSIGGGGGNGGSSSGLFSYGGTGEAGGNGGAVSIGNTADLTTIGVDASGLIAQSIGGGGGNGGDSSSGGAFFSLAMGGTGGPGGDGSTVIVDSTAGTTITTTGLRATGIHAQSMGGGGGNGGYAVSLSGGVGASVSVAIGGNGNKGGDGDAVTVTSRGNINTSGEDADGIRAESLGGGGGNGGGSVAVAGSDTFSASFTFGGKAGGGGSGSDVLVDSGGIINVAGERSIGVNALSLGGGGGSGGWSIAGSGAGVGSLSVGIGGAGGDGGNAGLVTVNSLSEVYTLGYKGYGIAARSIGGGGGDGGWSLSGAGAGGAAGTFSVGGRGGGGGDGGDVVVNTGGTIGTGGDKATGVLAESVGGGGGDGGWTISGAGAGGGALTVTIGGSGGDGGNGGLVTLTSNSDISTAGASAYGIRARSVGGGGGDGGFTLSGAGAGTAAATLNLGGSGGGGGDGSNVTVHTDGRIQTSGEKSVGILAASVGGGGGDGGCSITGSGAGTAALSVGIGGSGGDGGNGAGVSVVSGSEISTAGDRSHGIRARSIGGGGGDGGFTLSGSGAGTGAMTFNVGGSGGLGGDSGIVDVTSAGPISTEGSRAAGILAESIGGGGGDGGFSITGAGAGWGAVSVSVGGQGSAGGDGADVGVTSSGDIETLGELSYGIRARSIGGGGGDGGFSISGAGGGTFGGTFNLGGAGASGGHAGSVSVDSSGVIRTSGRKAAGILAESIGGGGGDGGFSITGSGAGTAAVSFGIGGGGDRGGNGAETTVTSTSTITTEGEKAHAIRARSIGGGGGDGGFSISGAGAGEFGATFNLGGSGGAGGNAGAVSVASDGSLWTDGNGAVGILAESIGGGGGDGGFSITGAGGGWGGFSIGIGGFGDGGGTGSTVAVANDGDINTLGARAYGIRARSIGGGGGDGGFSISGAGGGDYGGTFNVGGFGDTGGNADRVDVTNGGNISTFGVRAVGILAESVGGGGGDGGFSITGSGAGTGALSVGIGGGGDGGGDGGAVSVTNDGTVITLGEKAHGIRARSVGGGGGDGGFSITGSGAGDYSGTFSLGGSGALGGSGDAVGVVNNGMIAVSGREADGILAASVGGGGGSGGWSVSGSGAGKGAFNINIGGFGGDGGDGGAVEVANTQGILSLSEMGRGIVATSTGGGGGDGGFSFVGSFSGKGGKDLSIGVGGFGGEGGAGGEVRVTNDGYVDMSAQGGHGIVAASTGGGGGNGGASYGVGAGFGGDKDTWNVNVSTTVGGFGGDGNVGGAVFVTNSGSVITRNDDAHAVLATSTGGGGGNGGSSFAATIALGAGGEGRNINASIAVGGWGGTGNVGGDVSVTNAGDLETQGDKADAIHAQSIGGGGGNGGKSTGMSMLLDAGGKKVDPKKDEIAASNWNAQVNVGGNGGSGNNGGKVSVTNEGDIRTQGALSRGIVAQSIGAGGGSGGEAVKGTDTAADYVTLANNLGGSGKLNTVLKQLRDWSLTVGGNGGASGDADEVVINNTGSIFTEGFAATAIFAQSIGGGGGESQNYVQAKGEGGTATAGATGKVAIGGEGGTAGNGGAVDINHSGDIHTLGDEAYGIYAQSIGGGGGKAGNIDRALADGNDFVPVIKNIGIGLSFGRDGGGGGDGGEVTIDSHGTIVTEGDDAAGIHAQSIGGGGGESGGLPNEDIPILSLLSFKGSVGGAGSGGDVGVSHTGDILTLGAGSDGIFAQSAGGTGDGGGVTIDIHGSIIAQGADASGIVAQSVGEGGNGNIVVNVHDGMIVGGTGSGAAISVLDGRDNTISNSGELSTMSGIAGYSIISTGGNDIVENLGTMTGSVDLGSGVNRFENYGLVNSGSVVNVGDNNAFVNAGTLSPGGSMNIATTTLTGNFTQTVDGSLLVDVRFDYEDVAADLLSISGAASLGGMLNVNMMDVGSIMPGTHELVLVSGTGQLTDNGLSLNAHETPIIRYELVSRSETEIGMRYDVDFAVAGLQPNQKSFGEHINQIQLAGGSASIEPVVEMIVAQNGMEGVAAIYNRLSPHAYAANQAGRAFSNLNFDQSMHSCPVREGDFRFSRQGECSWLVATDRNVRYDSDAALRGASEDTRVLSFGRQRAMARDWFAGVALEYETTDLQVPDYADRDGYQVQLGGILKRSGGPHDVTFSASYGRGNYETHRYVNLPDPDVVAFGERDFDLLSAHSRYAYNIVGEKSYFRPSFDVGYTLVDAGGLTETGADAANLVVEGRNYEYLTARIDSEVGGEWFTNRGTAVRPYAKVGWTRMLSGATQRVTASLAAAPQGVDSFTQWTDLDDDFVNASVGLDILWATEFTLKLGYEGLFASDWDANSVWIKVLKGR